MSSLTGVKPGTAQRTRILIPSGVLGLGFDSAALTAGIAMQPDAICIDGGSTDSGPFYLGTGTSKYAESATRSEWRQLLFARQQAGVPLIIGSCGTCGSDAMVDWMFELTREIAADMGYQLKVAKLYSSQQSADLCEAHSNGRIHALEPHVDVDSKLLQSCSNIVALAGAEQICAALDTGADIVLAGRTTDTAVISALPLQRGASAGGAWHGAKIGECGALCSTNPVSGVILIDFDADGFNVQAMAANANCTPHSVSAHMLYENSNPLQLHEPGGNLDVASAQYSALDERSVRVTGSVWNTVANYTVKLEGSRLSGYQTSSLVLLREPDYVARAQEWCDKLKAFLQQQIEEKISLMATEYDMDFRLIGVNATLGDLEYLAARPTEVGVLMLITANSQKLATDIARLSNPFLLHFPLSPDEPLPTFAFPYSPAESERGPIYEFALNHVLELSNPMDAFRLETVEVGYGEAG